MSRNGVSFCALCDHIRHRETGSSTEKDCGTAFNSVAYQNSALSVQNREVLKGDHWVLFYSIASLDQSETSVLDSAGLQSHRPVNN